MEERIEELFKAYSQMVYRICVRYVGDREEAEDLTQEVFLKVDRYLSRFHGSSSFSTWIYRIAVNTCLDHLRAAKRHSKLSMDYLDQAVVRNISPAGDRELAKIDLDRILDQAKPEVRELLFLTQLEGMSYSEAAKMTGKKAEAIAKTVSRFKQTVSAKSRILTGLGFRQEKSAGDV